MKKIPRDAEASNVLVGEVDFLSKPFVAFVRLAQATTLGGLTEVPVPTRWKDLQYLSLLLSHVTQTLAGPAHASHLSCHLQIPVCSVGAPRKGQVV